MASDHSVTRLSGVVDETAQAKLESVQLDVKHAGKSNETIEERCLSAALICLEGHYTQSPPMGPLTAARVNSLIAKTLEKTHTCRKSRYVLRPNLTAWSKLDD
jgi:hypothetical protein